MGDLAARVGLRAQHAVQLRRDKNALVLALTQRAARPAIEQVAAIAARSADPATERMGQIITTSWSITISHAADVPARLRPAVR